MPRLVTKFQYLKPTARRKVGSYAQYIATREGVEAPEKTYADYIATRPRAERIGSHALFTDDGVPVRLAKVSEALNQYPGNIWTVIVSLGRENAERLGYDRAERWRDMLRTQTQALSGAFHIPLQNLKWYAAFHNEKHHPHVHMIIYSDAPAEGFLTKAGVEQLRSSLATDIFAQDLHSIYERQTEVRDALRALGREHIAAVIDEINTDGCDNPQLELLLMQLTAALSKTHGKKVYGYLDAEIKPLVDEIVDELAADPRIEELYDLWYEQREAVLQTYTDEPPERLPLSENPAFRPIKNAVIQEALRIIQEQMPHVSASSASKSFQNQPYALGILRLLQQLARAFEDRENEKQRTLRQMKADRKLLQKIEEKKQAHGLKQG